ncbi:DUF2528 family protein [Dysgonomonas macrotermitis]|uniref:Uncharacterized protein n=1 Tax=Dysgonomonas macrotermitis TaxID=1346286 RepID=A0A1M4UNJ2_9BACT|nr:DUF2528 family protein [Dysgonomonas macrotermitis]SHE58352.1 Protein of unknown function [Dysgonomonas macrotermitis]
MIKRYNYEYGFGEATVSFEVDTDIFTAELANETLTFFCWNYDKDADPVDEVMKKYALEAIKQATFNNYNEFGVIDAFNNNEGFGRLDGSIGITLKEVTGYEFDESQLTID